MEWLKGGRERERERDLTNRGFEAGESARRDVSLFVRLPIERGDAVAALESDDLREFSALYSFRTASRMVHGCEMPASWDKM